ncbi:hypothetical protein HRK28_01515 [Rathayibacter sp. VKM Ac-2835]|uniref:hypothetical protein n=1 Tax=Rathayibacter sp. VKM Ac-2835 TaxID=2739043 RepID=UPI001564C9B9|nr:hypothetical protein [Rathayibacter sp. VKM Ac-2835]NRG39588.1 hypothetical protein [Rathayibacter sp. VKM Ac-2835]
MSGVLLHDGRRIGHKKWCIDAISQGRADGVIITPFSTPRVAVPRHPSATDMVSAIGEVSGEVLFDPMTHAALLPTSNKWDFYDTWELWGPGGRSLAGPALQLAHVEKVFDRQRQLGAQLLAPTLQLDSPLTSDAHTARDLARVAQGLERMSGQSLVGTRSFWASGAHLDAYVGTLAALRAPLWVITVANDVVLDHVPDLENTLAYAGLCRTVHSLSLRSRVVIAYSDFSGLPGVAAGADTVGSGWDRAQRTFDPLAFRVDSDPGIRIPASYVTQGGLLSILRRDTADAIERWNPVEALRIRGAVMPPSDQSQRLHHLTQLRAAVYAVDGFGRDRGGRVDALRERYRVAQVDYDRLITDLSPVIREVDKTAWVVNQSTVLEAYASAEGL